ncbi:MAG: hypothetical protein JST70_05950 [Bacteroidetes bacterium]|nr:hypothetical protein [Bacteroidota bacterium]
MDITVLADYFDEKVSVHELKETIAEEVAETERSKALEKDVLKVYINNKCAYRLTAVNFIGMLNDYLSGALTSAELEYIFNVLEFLDDSWDIDEKVEKVYQLMAEPIIDYPINKENVSASRDFLNGATVDLLLEV